MRAAAQMLIRLSELVHSGTLRMYLQSFRNGSAPEESRELFGTLLLAALRGASPTVADDCPVISDLVTCVNAGRPPTHPYQEAMRGLLEHLLRLIDDVRCPPLCKPAGRQGRRAGRQAGQGRQALHLTRPSARGEGAAAASARFLGELG